MRIKRAYKVELNPNNKQEAVMRQYCGAARFIYNWGLNFSIANHKNGNSPLKVVDMDRELRRLIPGEFPWMESISSRCRQGALCDLDNAYKNFYNRLKAGKKGRTAGFPKFKSKKKSLGSFVDFAYTIKNNRIRLSKIGWVRLKESDYLPTGGYDKRHNDNKGIRFFSARVSEHAGRWYVRVSVELEIQEPKSKLTEPLGVDFGIKHLAVCSDGAVFHRRKHNTREQQLERKCRQVSRKITGSANRKKAVARLAILYSKINNLKIHDLHHISHVLTRKSSVLVIEDLNVKGMLQNRTLAKSIANAGFGELRRQIEYKSKWRGVELVVADRFFASSKTCHKCGVINADLKLSQRVWVCGCGEKLDRDLNAALNLRNLAASRAVSACGGESSGESFAVRETIPDEAGSGQEISVSVSLASSENGSIFNKKMDGLCSRCHLPQQRRVNGIDRNI